jgi:hypothetical protein
MIGPMMIIAIRDCSLTLRPITPDELDAVLNVFR